MSWLPWTLLVLVWVGSGVAAVMFLLHRRGHRDGTWYLLGAALGPLFIPIAYERSAMKSVVLERQGEAATGRDGSADGEMHVLVGVDGSPESEQAVRDAARFVGGARGRVVLASVVGADSAEREDDEDRDRARELLAREGARLGTATTVETRIVAGLPARALLELAEAEGIDLIVVGRRGRGLSRAVLGSVAQQLSSSSPYPVLLAAPAEREG
ncbi:universal stress protein [Candidatus Blastococcus massiliensis]|uniref:universal stress protein n=1 Tax=Candidatus Blastococcus massiliensis TaxID=1470358 RepID=UPI0004B33D5F|nr:universal stress protein [Candidatus Blastococcus massiliensis]